MTFYDNEVVQLITQSLVKSNMFSSFLLIFLLLELSNSMFAPFFMHLAFFICKSKIISVTRNWVYCNLY